MIWRWLAAATVVAFTVSCGGEDGAFSDGTGGSGASSSGQGGTSSGSGGQGVGGTTTSSGTGGDGGQGGSVEQVYDPAQDGPYAYTEIDGNVTASTGTNVDVHCAYPTAGPSAGPYPVVLFGHGFQLPPSQYFGYLRRLASFGYVAMTVDFPSSFISPNHVDNARELLAGLDWAQGEPVVSAIANTDQVGASGHSLGGKLALLAATLDARVLASITLDPVDGSMACSPQACPDVSALMPLGIPTGFVGETTDASGGFQPCAPAADNFETFYAGTSPPSLKVEVLGANHMSFLDDVGSCGITCSFCNQATAPADQVLSLSRAYLVAFYERHLRGNLGYDSYLVGADAQIRYVDTGQATIASK